MARGKGLSPLLHRVLRSGRGTRQATNRPWRTWRHCGSCGGQLADKEGLGKAQETRETHLLTVSEAARRCSVSRPHLSRLISRGVAGLCRGELTALRFEDLDFERGLIRVERSYDPLSRSFVEPESRSGARTVPMAQVLRSQLLAARLAFGRSAVRYQRRPPLERRPWAALLRPQ